MVKLTWRWRGADFSETSVDFYQTTPRPIVTKHNNINVYQLGYAVTQLTKQLRNEPEGRGFDPIWGIWNISLAQSFQPHYDYGVDLPFNRNEYQGYLLRGKGGRCLGMTTLPPSCDESSRNSGSLNLLSPKGLFRPYWESFTLTMFPPWERCNLTGQLFCLQMWQWTCSWHKTLIMHLFIFCY
jgi:hypothetical protein